MKKIISLILALLMLTSVTASATTVEFIIGEKTMAQVLSNTADRQLTTTPLLAAPFIENDRTMVPVRAISEAFDCQVLWNSDLRQVKIVGNDKEILLYIDSDKATVNGEEVTLDAAPVIVGDITFVPARFVTENMGYSVLFIPDSRSVLVYDQPDPLNVYEEPVLFPVADVMNYNIYLNEGIHPEETDNIQIKKYAEFLMNLYDFYANYMIQNGLDLTNDFAVTAKDIENAYSSNFLKGELSLLFGMLGTESITKAHLASVNAEEINKYYTEEFTCAKHILISTETRSEEEALKIVEEVQAGLAEGIDFDTLVLKYNEDPGMRKNPNGYLFTKGEMVKEFEETAFALTAGEVSAPVKTQFGYHIIKGVELPAINQAMINRCVTTLYLNNWALFINEGINQKYAESEQ